jgi:hypothetical protein|tara:strand:+ start:589 stop:1017 length:429 start_codon:yes stop_codon:yes gene_type:complete
MAIIQGEAYWASVTSPNTTYDPVYTVNLVVDDNTAEDFRSRGFSVKQMDEGQALVIKRKVNGPNGMVRPAPRLVDKFKNPLDSRVGNGSSVRVQYKEWESEWKGKVFKGLDFQAMQVIDLVEVGSPDGSEFDVVDSNMEDEL